MRPIRIAAAAAILVIGSLGILGAFHWTVNRIYVREGQSLLLRYKGPLVFGGRKAAQLGHYAQAGEIGVLKEMRGPGRHFYCPIWWERTIVSDVVIVPGEIGIVTSKIGVDLPQGGFLVTGDVGTTSSRGTLRNVLSPGRYRINQYGYDVKIIKEQIEKVGDQKKYAGWVNIPTGYVGVVTQRWDDVELNKAKGIAKDVLQPGLYAINPWEQQVDIVQVGYRETSISVSKQMSQGRELIDKSGEPVAVLGSGIGFPSNDGFPIQLDFTAVWGVMPDQAPDVIRTFGNINAVEQKVILPQSESICRNNGSKMGAVELLVGQSRQKFQTTTQTEFKQVLKEKNIEFLYGLVRHIYIPQEVRLHIQQGYVADELTLTREQEKLTATTEGDLREAESKVSLEKERIRVETEKLVANKIAEGHREAKEIEAESKQLVAQVEKRIAEVDAQKTVMLGEAVCSATSRMRSPRAH